MKRSKRVSWASRDYLVQVKLFHTEDCPSQVGEDSNDLPPGFEGGFCLNQSKKELYLIPKILWKCPPKIVVKHGWLVAGGEQSHESAFQKLREAKVLEAVYPRVTMVPSSPYVSREIEDEQYDDSLTPIILNTPIEEKAEIPSDFSAPLCTTVDSQSPMPPGGLNSSKSDIPILEPPSIEKPAVSPSSDMNDIVTAASSVVSSVIKMKENGSLIDPDLLVKIFNDREMIEKLTNVLQTSAKAGSAPVLVSNAVTSFPSCPNPTFVSAPVPADGKLQHSTIDVRPTSKPDIIPPSSSLQPSIPVAPFTANGSSHRHLPMDVPAPRPVVENLKSETNGLQPSLNSLHPLKSPAPQRVTAVKPNGLSQLSVGSMKISNVKDINYIKNLIREHGTEKNETQARSIIPLHSATRYSHKRSLENLKLGEHKARYQKSCIYFNGPRGCRNGSNCLYKHDLSIDMVTGGKMEVPCAKRMKLDGELTGRS